MGLGPNDLLNDFNTFGLLFETLAVRDLRTYADALMGKVAHYRDVTNLMVLIGIGEIAYRRDDGVYVVPLGCLKD